MRVVGDSEGVVLHSMRCLRLGNRVFGLNDVRLKQSTLKKGRTRQWSQNHFPSAKSPRAP